MLGGERQELDCGKRSSVRADRVELRPVLLGEGQVGGYVDAKRNVLVYVIDSDKLIEGSPKKLDLHCGHHALGNAAARPLLWLLFGLRQTAQRGRPAYRAPNKLGARVTLMTRGGFECTRRFPVIAAALQSLPAPSLILDGEIVSIGDDGLPDFGALHSGRRHNLRLYVFDLLHLDGIDFGQDPLTNRKALLKVQLGLHRHPSVGWSRHSRTAIASWPRLNRLV